MVYVRRHPILSTTPAAPSGRRTPAWRAAAVLAAVFTAGLFTSTFFSSRSSGGLSGPKSNEPAPNAAAPPEQGKATQDPIIPGPDTQDNPQDSYRQDSDTRNPAIRGAQDADSPALQDPNAPNVAQAPPVQPLAPNPGLNVWLDRGLPADPGTAPRAPEAGSEPSMAPLADGGPPPALVAQDRPTRLSFPHRSTGQMLFLTGFLLLVLSIGGLVTVGIYRRRW
jgi:hypothetical protein